MAKFKRDVCEVCGDPIIDVSKLPVEIQEKVYKPPPEQAGEVIEIELKPPGGFRAIVEDVEE